MRRQVPTTQPRRGGFTIVELLIMILIVAVLIGLLTVGMRRAIAVARRAAGTQDVNSLKIGVESFRNDFGFIPPLVKDGYPTGLDDQSPQGPLVTDASTGRTRPETYLSGFLSPTERENDRKYLITAPGEDDFRFSNYSLAYYLMGALGRDIDGQEGPGSRKPLRDGSFDRMTNETYPARYEPKGGQLAYVPWDQSDSQQKLGRWAIQDRNGVAYRYYRWEAARDGDPGYSANTPLANLRVPKLFGDARFDADPAASPAQDLPKFRDAGYAIVAAGADGVFGDVSEAYGFVPGDPPTGYPALETIDSLLDAIGKRFSGSDDEIKTQAENAARADNIVEVGK